MLVAALALALVLRALYLHLKVSHAELMRRDAKGSLIYEVRRHTYMKVLPLHLSEYPEPREVRTRVFRLIGVVLWRRALSICRGLCAP